MQQLALGQKGSPIGDETLIGGKILTGDVRGFTSATCVTVSTVDGGIAQCEVDLVLTGGIVMTRGVSAGTSPFVSLAVVGGTGRYTAARGSGTLQPTKSGSVVSLTLR